MNLSFEAGIDDIILERGLDYFQNGRIEKVDEQEQNHYTIWIAGTSEYTVHVNLDAANEIVDSECDCPYDQGDYCKHQAAAFYMLRSKKIGDKHPAVHRQRDIKDILGELPKDELIHIISAIADQHEEIKKELLFLYAPEEDLTASSRKVIREFINREKRRGFIEWNRLMMPFKAHLL
ncbi:SWIM zinc finger family protein [Terrilactibacillus sp. S3-3]|nr:SWIM zinc finger family protein [Terrilactibacillus sp. S3-3]